MVNGWQMVSEMCANEKKPWIRCSAQERSGCEKVTGHKSWDSYFSQNRKNKQSTRNGTHTLRNTRVTRTAKVGEGVVAEANIKIE